MVALAGLALPALPRVFKQAATECPEITHDDGLTDRIPHIANQEQSGRLFGACAFPA